MEQQHNDSAAARPTTTSEELGLGSGFPGTGLESGSGLGRLVSIEDRRQKRKRNAGFPVTVTLLDGGRAGTRALGLARDPHGGDEVNLLIKIDLRPGELVQFQFERPGGGTPPPAQRAEVTRVRQLSAGRYDVTLHARKDVRQQATELKSDPFARPPLALGRGTSQQPQQQQPTTVRKKLGRPPRPPVTL